MLYNWHHRTILIAEDDEMNYRYLEMIFKRFTQINLIWAINGQMAIDFCEIYKHIDIVIMDLQLPVIDGLEATRKIKAMKPRLPVIAHTAYTSSEEIERCYEAGCDDCVTKPVIFQDLLSRIENLLNPVHSKNI